MAGRVPVAEDADTITKRIAELRAERTANLNCLCRRSDDGKILDSSQCPVHRPGAAPIAAVAPAPVRMPEDDWESLRAAVGFVVRVDSDRPRVITAQSSCQKDRAAS